MFFAVRLSRSGPWDWSRDLREQDGCEEHAALMDARSIEPWTVLLDGRKG